MKERAFLRLQECAATGFKHKYYDHTVEYAKKLNALNVADESAVETLLKQFSRRETSQEFDQRKKITKLLTGAVINRIEVPFAKAMRTDGVTTTFKQGDKITDQRSDITGQFIGSKNVFDYILDDARRIRKVDPNAFLAMEFDNVDVNKEKFKSYPVVYKSHQVLDFLYQKEVLQHLVVKLDENRFIAYFQGGNFLLTKVDDDKATKSVTSDLPVNYDPSLVEFYKAGYTMRVNSVTFTIQEFSNTAEKIKDSVDKTKTVFAHRLGYLADESNDGETCVSHLHPALNRLERMLIANSESDLTRALHVFAQKVMATEPCSGYQTSEGHRIECNGGFEVGTNNECKNCHGSGIEPVNTSAQDIIYVSTRKGEEMPDLNKVMVYVRTDLETPKYLEEWIERMSAECLKDVFAGNSFSTASAQQTATYVQVNYESVYDAVTPYCKKTSEIFQFICESRSLIELDQPLVVTHSYPVDLELETLNELVEQYKNSDTAPIEVRKRIRDKIIRRSMNNEPIGMRKAIIKLSHEPFACMTFAERAEAMSSGLVPVDKKILWANYEDIMNALFEDDAIGFISLPWAKREALIKQKIEEIKAIVSPQIPV